MYVRVEIRKVKWRWWINAVKRKKVDLGVFRELARVGKSVVDVGDDDDDDHHHHSI